MAQRLINPRAIYTYKVVVAVIVVVCSLARIPTKIYLLNYYNTTNNTNREDTYYILIR